MRLLVVSCLGLVGCLVEENDEQLSSTSQPISYVAAVTSLQPVGYWRFGELQGSTIATDIGPFAMHGGYGAGATLQVSHPIQGDTDTAVQLNGTSSGFVNVNNHKVLNLTRAWDNFNRTVTPGTSWGASGSAGEVWVAQSMIGAHYSVNSNRGLITTTGISGTFQQGLPNTNLRSGEMQVRCTWTVRASGGPLQPCGLIAQRSSDGLNYVVAELVEQSTNNHRLDLRIVKYVNGVPGILHTAAISNYQLGQYWYIRFRFDNGLYSARAWRQGTLQPEVWQSNASSGAGADGSIAIRSTNTQSNSRPVVHFEGFWAQTLGLSMSLFVKIDYTQPSCWTPDCRVELWGKGATADEQYLLRYFPPNKLEYAPNGALKFYTFDRSGYHGNGVHMDFCEPKEGGCPAPPNPLDSKYVSHNYWNHLVLIMNPGDALDRNAGVEVWLNGNFVGGQADGAAYNGTRRCVDAVSPVAGNPSLRGIPGTCTAGNCTPKETFNGFDTEPTYCTDNSHCMGIGPGLCDTTLPIGYRRCKEFCWNVYPVSTNNPLKVGTKDGLSYLKGGFDEMAFFSRALTASEVQTLRNGINPP